MYRSIFWCLILSLLVIAPRPVPAQDRESWYFDLPMARVDPSGRLVPGYGIGVLQIYGNGDGPYSPRKHAGVDLWYIEGGSATIGAPVYAVAEGVIVCENWGKYPGRVIVIEHQLPNGGGKIYSQYGHLRYPVGDWRSGGDPDLEDPDAISVETPEGEPTRVSRGQRIGNIMSYNADGAHDGGPQPGNTHLHFEIRRFALWECEDPPTCGGPGYAPLKEEDPGTSTEPEDWGWVDPIAFYFEHRPPYPRNVLNWSVGASEIRNVPRLDWGRKIGDLGASGEALALLVIRELEHRECPGGPEFLHHWWYLVRHEGRVGWVNGYRENTEDCNRAALMLSEPPIQWSPPITQPLIHYTFDEPSLFYEGTVVNHGRNGQKYNGMVVGWAELVDGEDMGPGREDYAMALDGNSAFVEVANSTRLGFSSGVVVSAFILRASNEEEDAIASKWYGPDQWLLTLYPIGNGKLIFTLCFQDGSCATVDYLIPDSDYLGRWVHVAAEYQAGGHFRLYWDGNVVADRPAFAGDLALAWSDRPIHIGDAGPGTWWSRFEGRLDDIEIWSVTPAPGGLPR